MTRLVAVIGRVVGDELMVEMVLCEHCRKRPAKVKRLCETCEERLSIEREDLDVA